MKMRCIYLLMHPHIKKIKILPINCFMLVGGIFVEYPRIAKALTSHWAIILESGWMALASACVTEWACRQCWYSGLPIADTRRILSDSSSIKIYKSFLASHYALTGPARARPYQRAGRPFQITQARCLARLCPIGLGFCLVSLKLGPGLLIRSAGESTWPKPGLTRPNIGTKVKKIRAKAVILGPVHATPNWGFGYF